MSEVNEKEVDLKKALADLKTHNEKQTKGAIDAYGVQAREAMESEVGKLSDELKDIKTAMNRQSVVKDAVDEIKDEDSGFIQKLWNFMSNGEASDLCTDKKFDLDTKALSAGGSANTGGNIVQTPIQIAMDKILTKESPMRSLATIHQSATVDFEKIFDQRNATSGWVGETDERPLTNTPTMEKVIITAKTQYANLKTTQELLDDSYFNPESWLVESGSSKLVEVEGEAFVTGAGSATVPQGFLAASALGAEGTFGTPTAAVWGKYNVYGTATIGAIEADDIVQLPYTLIKAYRNNGRYLMSRQMLAVVKTMVDTNGRYIWIPGFGSQPDTINGYPVDEIEEMSGTVAAGQLVVAFGDFKKGYGICDRIGTTLLRDPYTAHPEVIFKLTKRVGAGVLDSNAVSVLKVRTA